MRKIFLILTAFFFSVIITISQVSAYENKGSINVYLEEGKQGTNIEGVEFKLVKVANLIDGEYVYTEQYNSMNIDLNNINTAEELNNASNNISTVTTKNNINGLSKKTDKYGVIQFDNLQNGVYLLQAININNYDNISPTLVAIPTFDRDTSIDGGMNYDISVVPKHTPITAVKTDDNSNAILFLGLCASSIYVGIITKKYH